MGGGERLGGVDDPAAAERDEQLAVDVGQQGPGELVDATGRDLVDRRRAGSDLGGEMRARGVVRSV